MHFLSTPISLSDIVCLNKIINKEYDMFMLIEEDENKSRNITVAFVCLTIYWTYKACCVAGLS